MSGIEIQERRFTNGEHDTILTFCLPFLQCKLSETRGAGSCPNYLFCASHCRKEVRIFSQMIGLLTMLTKLVNMSGKKTVPPWAFLQESLWITLSKQVMISVKRHHFWVFHIQIFLLQSREGRHVQTHTQIIEMDLCAFCYFGMNCPFNRGQSH